MSFAKVFSAGRVAVITGSATGIGFAAASRCAGYGMKVVMADVSPSLDESVKKVELIAKDTVVGYKCDVSNFDDVQKLADEVFSTYGEVAFLMNNAGIGLGGAVGEKFDEWLKVLGVNLYGVLHGCHIFSPRMKLQKEPSMIVNTGSKQGITCPPGNTAYNCSKAGVKVITEGLEHTLRNTQDCLCTAHLLVPGWTNTSIVANMMEMRLGAQFDKDKVPFSEEKPAAGAWSPAQVIDYMEEMLKREKFYILCPDNDVTVELDKKRIQWTADDMIKDRPPLSRWHADYKDAFAQFAAQANNEEKKLNLD